MWLRDFLPENVPGARILTYGYDSTLLGNSSTASIREFSRNLLGDLNTVRANEDVSTHPALIVCVGFRSSRVNFLGRKNTAPLYSLATAWAGS